MNEQEAAIRIGKGRSFFHTMKIQRPDQYRIINELGGGDIVSGYYQFEKRKQNTRDSLAAIYYALSDSRLVLAFSTHLSAIGLFGNSKSFADSISRIPFTSSLVMSVPTLTKYEQIVKEYERWAKVKT